MHYTGDTEAKLRLSIINAVTANNLNTRLFAYASSAFEDACTHLRAELGQRQAEDRERARGLPAHRVDIREAIRRRDASEIKGVIHNRHEEIDRLNDGNLAREAYYGPVVTVSRPTKMLGSPVRGRTERCCPGPRTTCNLNHRRG